jgi:23S rRNA pseudouridine1911/1915/1917 synthase
VSIGRKPRICGHLRDRSGRSKEATKVRSDLDVRGGEGKRLSVKRIAVKVEPGDAGERLDKVLAAHSGLSRGQCRRAITEGGVWLARRRLKRLSLPVEAGWLLEIVLDESAEITAEPTVIFEDRALLVIAKPAGLATQGTLASDQRNALGWAMRYTDKQVRTVHRLDIGTSGVLVLAQTNHAATDLAAQFREGSVEKRYLAIGVGALPEQSGQLTGGLREAERRGSFEVSLHGVPAVTDYRVLAQRPPLLLIEARPRTGRTHQIRVHLAAAGAPLLGDDRYGGPRQIAVPGLAAQAARPLLHAASIRLRHPYSHEPVVFETPPPADFESVARLVQALA